MNSIEERMVQCKHCNQYVPPELVVLVPINEYEEGPVCIVCMDQVEKEFQIFEEVLK